MLSPQNNSPASAPGYPLNSHLGNVMLIKKHDKSRIVELEVTSSALVSSEAGIVTPNAFAAYPRERTF